MLTAVALCYSLDKRNGSSDTASCSGVYRTTCCLLAFTSGFLHMHVGVCLFVGGLALPLSHSHMHTSVRVCIYRYTYTYIYMYASVCVYIYVSHSCVWAYGVYEYVCMFVCTCLPVHRCLHVCMYICVVYVCTYALQCRNITGISPSRMPQIRILHLGPALRSIAGCRLLIAPVMHLSSVLRAAAGLCLMERV